MKQDKKNYHSRLLDLSKRFDPVIERLKRSNTNNSWFLHLISLPGLDLPRSFKKLTNPEDPKDNPVYYSVILLFSFSAGFLPLSFAEDPLIDPFWFPLVTFLIGYALTLPHYYKSMLRFQSPHFHLGGYRRFRRQEYDLLHASLNDDNGDFYFEGLYDFYIGLQTEKNDFERFSDGLKEAMSKHFDIEKRDLNADIERKDRAIEEMEEVFDNLVERQQSTIEEYQNSTHLLSVFIRKINDILFRINDNSFDLSDLSFFSGITFFELKDGHLYKIIDRGTPGFSPDKIPVNEEESNKWSAVKAALSDYNVPIQSYTTNNRTIVSIKPNSGINSDKEWVLNFQFHEDDPMPVNLLLKNDTIESQEIFNLMYALCLIYDKIDVDMKDEE